MEGINNGNNNHDTRLELAHRNMLQRVIIQRLLGREKTHDQDAMAAWDPEEKFRRISDIIDAPENEHIRQIARAGQYDAAADIVIPLIEN